MKKRNLLFGVLVVGLFPAISNAACDQDFYRTLRYGKEYDFADNYNANSSDKWVWDFWYTYDEKGGDFNQSSYFPDFQRTQAIKKADRKIAKNTSMKVIETDSNKPGYEIKAVPSKRSYDNLLLTYTIESSTNEAGNNKYKHTECVHYEISRCGDGVLDSAYETCDPADTSHKGWGNGGCDEYCKPITVVEKDPECNSTYDGQTKYTSSSAHWLSSTDNLCSEGSVVDFSYTPSTGGPRTYTWNCQKGTKKTDPCSAKQQWCGDGEKNGNEECDPESPDWKNRSDGKTCNSSCEIVEPSVDGTLEIEKTLVGSKEVKNVGDIVTWKIKVTAKDGDVTNFVVTDKLPGVLEYDSYKVTHNPGLTVGSPTFDGNKVKWNVTGKIKKGEYLEIELKTKVKVMPEKDYTNVACVKSEKNPEKCDEEVLPVDGKLEIEKTLVGSKEVKKVGDTVTWIIKATAAGEDVKDPIITDKLPSILGYSSSLIKSHGSTTISSEPTIDGNILTRKATGTLKKGEYIEIQLTTYAKEMPDKEYENVACVKSDKDPEKCDDEPVPAPKLWIKKYILDGDNEVKKKTVKIGDEIIYKIKFGNKGTASATITSIKDFLPKNVKYKSSEIFKISGNNSSSKVDGVEIDTYGGITLNPGDEGYIIIKGTILGENLDSTKQNWACIYLNDKKPDDSVIDEDSGVKDNPSCDYAEHEIDNGLCKKLDIPSGNIGKSGGSKTVSCTASEQVDMIEIDCGNGTIFTGSNISLLDNKTCTYPAGSKTYNLKCTVKKDGKDYTSDSCKGSVTVEGGGGGGDDPYCQAPVQGGDKFTCESTDKVYAIGIDCNHVVGKESVDKQVKSENGREKLSVSESCNSSNKVQCYVKKDSNSGWETIADKCGWSPTPPCFPAGTKVIMADGTKKNIEDVKEGEYVLSYNTTTNTNEKNIVKKRLIHEDSVHEMYELTINEEVLKVTDAHRFYVRKTSTSKEYDWIEAKYLKVGDILLMSNGSLAEIEKISHYPNIETVYNFEIENNHNYFVAEGYLVHNSKGGGGGGGGGGGDDPIYDSVNCFNVNAGNASIQQGEVLPFYWNIEKLNDATKNGLYVEYKLSNYPYGNAGNYANILGESCTEDEDGQIALNSMVCHFAIKDGTGKVKYSDSYPCLKEKTTVITPSIVKAWADWSRDKYTIGSNGVPKQWTVETFNGTNYSFRTNVNYINNFGLNAEVFGEYKIALTKVEYAQCQDKKWRAGGVSEIECQSNFVITNPYTVQKTPSGNLKASTETLSKYKYMNGTAVMSMSNLLNAIATTEYEPNNTVNNAMMNFINKYEKLAVTVKNGNGKIIKKVPGKNIYFVEGNLNLGGSNADVKFDKPVTFVQTKGNTTIVGSFTDLNMMLLTNGKIIFEDTENCNPTSTQYRQIVKGIFYAKSGIERAGVLKNNEINKYRRCTQGGLTVKGVLIGKGLQGMMDNSRSNLNGWFETSDKKGTVMNGASVLIEYSPSVFTKSTMPPGAEDFTTALSIYKN